MTLVDLYRDGQSHDIVGFKVSGHSGYAEAGEDIVCAGISTLTINTVNSIEKFTGDKFVLNTNEDNALIELKMSSLSNESKILLQAFELGITSIAQNNAEYLLINFKEV